MISQLSGQCVKSPALSGHTGERFAGAIGKKKNQKTNKLVTAKDEFTELREVALCRKSHLRIDQDSCPLDQQKFIVQTF